MDDTEAIGIAIDKLTHIQLNVNRAKQKDNVNMSNDNNRIKCNGIPQNIAKKLILKRSIPRNKMKRSH
jgi:uncharacterized sporulation protein YeaH/YhbH (DUF444 family)